MKKSKFLKLTITILSLTLLLSACGEKNYKLSKKENDGDICILFTNDIHCGIAETDAVGYAGLAAYKKEMESKYNYLALIDAGDYIQGGPIGTLSKGSYIIQIMNKLGYDFATIGNHEFDYGVSTLIERNDELNCHMYACNFMDTNNKTEFFNPYKIITFGKVKIAFVGCVTPETFASSRPTYFQDENGNYIYSFCEDKTGAALYNQVQKSVNDARKEGADYVILVGHLGDTSVKDIWKSKTVLSNTTGIDYCIDAHSHEEYTDVVVKNKNGEDVLLSQTGTKLKNVGQLIISKDGTMSTTLVSKDMIKAEDADAVAFIENIQNSFKEKLDDVVATSNNELVTTDSKGNRLIRNAETNLGDFLADAYKTVLDADIGLVNGGGIRASLPAGDITYNMALTVFPFNNMACSIEATGQQIKDCLEMSVRNYPEESGGFLHVSGITYTLDSSIPSSININDKGNFDGVGGEYRVRDIMINGELINLDKTYSVASYDYLLLNGGDGFTMFKGNTVLKDRVLPDVDVFVDYLKAEGSDNYPNVEGGAGRLTIKK